MFVNANMAGVLVAILADVVLAENVPNPTLVLEASVGFGAGLPKLNEGSGVVVWFVFVAGLVTNAFGLSNTDVANEGNVLLLPVDCGNVKYIVGVEF